MFAPDDSSAPQFPRFVSFFPSFPFISATSIEKTCSRFPGLLVGFELSVQHRHHLFQVVLDDWVIASNSIQPQ